MKYLSNYIDESTSKVLKDNGAFFAFSNSQFDEQKKTGVKYTSCGQGLICPSENVDRYIKEMDSVISKGMAQDIAENGKDNIIRRELANHEAYYSGDIESTYLAIFGYGITKEEVLTIYRQEANKHHLYL